ncbi:MAG TPA: glycosyltransferase [Longimicrobiales bacterium]|nr:glycosyltransferase [Longimicrobiales bacterium]
MTDTPAESRPAPLRVLAWPAFKNRRRNPYNALLYEHLAALGVEVAEYSAGRLLTGRFDVWHLHWPDSHLRERRRPLARLRLHALLRLMDVARLRGTRVVWTVHNLRSHEARHPALERWFWPEFTRRLDAFVSLSETGRGAARLAFPALADKPGFVVPHGHYREVYPNAVAREEARRRLGIDSGARVVAFIGLIRPYKNVPALVRAFREMDGSDLVLLVAGKPSDEEAARVPDAAGDDARVRCRLEFVPDDEVQLHLNAADLVALPYREVLNSGSALLALSFDRPVLVPDRGAMAELRQLVGGAWVRTYEGELSAGELAAALAWARTPRPTARAPLDALDWPVLAARLKAALEAVAPRQAGAG